MELQIERITVTRGATINKGNYENERVDVSMTALVHPEQSHSLVLNDLRAAVESALKAEVVRTLDSIGEAGSYRRREWDARFVIAPTAKSVTPEYPAAGYDGEGDDDIDDDDDFDDGFSTHSFDDADDDDLDDTESNEDDDLIVAVVQDEHGDDHVVIDAGALLDTAKQDDAPFAL